MGDRARLLISGLVLGLLLAESSAVRSILLLRLKYSHYDKYINKSSWY